MLSLPPTSYNATPSFLAGAAPSPFSLTPGGQSLPAFAKTSDVEKAQEDKVERRVKSFAMAAGLFTAAVLMKRIPTRTSAYTMVPTDWKQWVKAGLGVAGISQLNQGLDWKPPLWLGTAETVAILTPLLQKLEKGMFRQVAILLPLITGLVQLNHWVSSKVEAPLQRNFHIPPIVTQLVFSVLTTIVGIKTFPPIDKAVGGLMAKRGAASGTATQGTTISTGISCARGCCASMVCMNEIGEYSGALWNWMKQKQTISGGKS